MTGSSSMTSSNTNPLGLKYSTSEARGQPPAEPERQQEPSKCAADREQSVDKMLSKSQAPRVRPVPDPSRRYEGSTAVEPSAAARTSEEGLDGRNAAEVWSWYSPYPREAGIAGRRFVGLARKLANVPLLYAISEAAVEGHHAAGSLIEPYLRSRIARINETLRDMEKAEERDDRPRKPLARLDVSAFLRGIA